jgi:carbonic anhydrase
MAFSRRSFISASAASFVSAGSLDFLATSRLHAQMPITPDEALKELMDGNERFAAGNMTSIAHDLKVLKERTVDKQEPFAAVLACADSRVPVELIFDQTLRESSPVIAPMVKEGKLKVVSGVYTLGTGKVTLS